MEENRMPAMKTKTTTSAGPAAQLTEAVRDELAARRGAVANLDRTEAAAGPDLAAKMKDVDDARRELDATEYERARRKLAAATVSLEAARYAHERAAEGARAVLGKTMLTPRQRAAIDQARHLLARQVTSIETDQRMNALVLNPKFAQQAAEKIPAYNQAAATILQHAPYKLDPVEFVNETLRSVGLTLEIIEED
jgi:hypothetical protein